MERLKMSWIGFMIKWINHFRRDIISVGIRHGGMMPPFSHARLSSALWPYWLLLEIRVWIALLPFSPPHKYTFNLSGRFPLFLHYWRRFVCFLQKGFDRTLHLATYILPTPKCQCWCLAYEQVGRSVVLHKTCEEEGCITSSHSMKACPLVCSVLFP